MAEEGLLCPLVITEEGDTTEDVAEKGATSSLAAIAPGSSAELALREEEEHTGEDKNEEVRVSKMCLEEQSLGKLHSNTEGDQTGEDEEVKREETENMSNGLNREAQSDEVMRIHDKSEKPGVTEDGDKPSDPQVIVKRLNVSKQQPKGTRSGDVDPKEAHRLTPDFPDALYELLCTLQEGRRLNDQRCSFMLEGGLGRRRCHSVPNTPNTKPAHRVVFSSMTSLQTEEFFEQVATAQARRLDDQRAQLERSQPPKPKARTFRGSIKQLSFARKPAPAPVPVPKEDLYNMILTTQAQGRLEDQRSRAPGPMDDEDFFSLLLRVQGGRMEEQRTELPLMLET